MYKKVWFQSHRPFDSTNQSQAESMDPSDPVYPSNLSAALYEIANYADCVKAILRAWTLLQSDPKPGLLVRLSTRLAKALCNGFRGGMISSKWMQEHGSLIGDLEASATGICSTDVDAASLSELTHVWREWKRLRSLSQNESVEALKNFSQLRILTPPW